MTYQIHVIKSLFKRGSEKLNFHSINKSLSLVSNTCSLFKVKCYMRIIHIEETHL